MQVFVASRGQHLLREHLHVLGRLAVLLEPGVGAPSATIRLCWDRFVLDHDDDDDDDEVIIYE